MKLDAILNTLAVPLEVDAFEFRLTPFSNARVIEWNRTQRSVPEDATDEQVIAVTEEIQVAQRDIIATHMKACLTKGDPKKITGKWVGETFPQPVLVDLAQYFANGQRPSWAGESGN